MPALVLFALAHRGLASRAEPMRKERSSVVTVSQPSQQNHDACQGISVDGATELRRRCRSADSHSCINNATAWIHKSQFKEVPKPQRRLPCGFELAAPCGAFGTPNMRGILSVGAGAPGRGSKAPKKSRMESSILRLPRVVCGFDVVPRT